MTREEAEKKLSAIFGFNGFYDLQWCVIERIMQGQRVLFVARTGFGKSLCFQFPATQFDGMTVVFSPLLALMRDQVRKLNESGISANCINSEKSPEENEKIIEQAKSGKIKILYIAPERMQNYEWLQGSRQMKLSIVVVDEAHCISTWGHDFRPAYRRIVHLVNLLPDNFPVLATTATATEVVQKDVSKQMGSKVIQVRGPLIRNNFQLNVVRVKSDDEKLVWLGENINKFEGTGIIYAGTRLETKIYSGWLQSLGINSVNYSAQLTPEARLRIEEGFLNNKWKCVVSTNALGMGIDKPDIRFLVHAQIPQSPIHYYQEIGRAGRDGKQTPIYLLYNPADRDLPEAFIRGNKPSRKEYISVIDALTLNRLGERQIMMATNLNNTQVRVIIADLLEQGIISEILEKHSRKYEIRYGSPPLDTDKFEKLREQKFSELEKMLKYAEYDRCRMYFLTQYLGDRFSGKCEKCDNDLGISFQIKTGNDWMRTIQEFRENNPPVLELEIKGSNMVNGIAASYYGNSNVGTVIHECKYGKGGHYPEFLLQLTIKALRKAFGTEEYNLIFYVPPTESNDLVADFASRLAESLNIPVSHKLIKIRKTEPQKVFQNIILKRNNVKGAFNLEEPSEVQNKSLDTVTVLSVFIAKIRETSQNI